MQQVQEAGICDYFKVIPDPRIDRTKKHLLTDIFTIAICAVICGADSWVAIEQFGKAKIKWLKSFLSLEFGIPSHDTFGRVFAAIDPKAFCDCFIKWVSNITNLIKGDIIAVDGKELRHSFDNASDKAAIHIVSAWSDANRVVLGQVKVDGKSNEITAIPKLLDMLMIKGCTVTIDAMGCQKKIVKKIIERGADYVIGLKGNQETLLEETKEFFDYCEKTNFKNISHAYHKEIEGDHGRIETREVWVTNSTDWFEDKSEWEGLNSLVMVKSQRIVKNETSSERRYYISSFKGIDAVQIANAVRKHWGVENKLHWVLDVSFKEDDSRVRIKNAAENFSTLRRIALNLLQKENSTKVGKQIKRLKAGWSNDYLLSVLGI